MMMVVVRRYWSGGLAIWWKLEVTEARATLRSCTMRCGHCFIWFVMMVMTRCVSFEFQQIVDTLTGASLVVDGDGGRLVWYTCFAFPESM